jgi:hypothetical protein
MREPRNNQNETIIHQKVTTQAFEAQVRSNIIHNIVNEIEGQFQSNYHRAVEKVQAQWEIWKQDYIKKRKAKGKTQRNLKWYHRQFIAQCEREYQIYKKEHNLYHHGLDPTNPPFTPGAKH